MPSHRHRSCRLFGVVFSLTVCILLTGAGFVIADYNTRSTGVGDEAGLLTAHSSLDEALDPDGPEASVPAGEAAGKIWPFLPVTWKAGIWMAEGEIRLACEAVAALFS